MRGDVIAELIATVGGREDGADDGKKAFAAGVEATSAVEDAGVMLESLTAPLSATLPPPLLTVLVVLTPPGVLGGAGVPWLLLIRRGFFSFC